MDDKQFNLLLNELKAIKEELIEVKTELKKPKAKKICPECKQQTLRIIRTYLQDSFNPHPRIKAECLNEKCGFVYKGLDQGIHE